MKRLGRTLLLATLTIAVLRFSPPTLAAQDTTQVVTPESADTVPPPPAAVPIKEMETPPGPLPPGSRRVFTRDSILWSGAATLSDLLREIPGVYIARAGFVGLPEYLVYGGRGAGALEIYWDGLRMEPLGSDTLFIDPTRIPLSLLRRVEVELLPAVIRVYLVSERHERLDPRSFIQVASGSFSTTVFAGMFQHRWRNGLEVTAAANFLSGDGAAAADRTDQVFDIFARMGWLPTPTVGAEYQIRRQDEDRDSATTELGMLAVRPRRGTRTDLLFTMFAATRPDGLGFRAEGGLGVSAWDPDSGSAIPEQRVRRAYVETRYQTTSWTAAVRATLGDARTVGGVEGRIGWVPLTGLVLSGDARWERHDGGRTSRRAHGAIGLYYGPLSVVGQIGFADAVQVPALLADSTQRTIDRAVRLGIDTRLVSGHVGVVERDTYAPLAIPDLPIARFDTSAKSTYLDVEIHLQPIPPLTLSVWFSDPIRGTAASLQPPNHTRAAVTFRSKYWRTFRSGAFDVRLQAALEAWGDGSAGRDAAGSSLLLPAATFTELLLEFQLGRFTGFWNLRNAGNRVGQYVPGMPYPLSGQRFGVKWVFAN